MSTKILPIVLRCNSLTLQERTILKKQRKNRKVTKNSIKFSTEDLFIPPNAIEVENSNMSIKEVAEKVISQMYKLNQINSAYAEDNSLIY